MKKNTIIGVCVAMLVIVVAIVLWPRANRGEFKSELGSIYYFSDGLVAIDTSRTPNECYIYIDDPKAFEKVEIRGDGLWVEGAGVAEGAEEFVGGKISVGYSRPEPGKVKVIENKGEWTDSRRIDIGLEEIRACVDKRDWDASVRELLKE